MALFSNRKNNNEKTKAAPAAVQPVEKGASIAQSLSHILKHARITEKAGMQQARGVYVFDIAMSATKRDVKQAIRSLYKVTPRAVRIVPVPAKATRSMRTGKSGVSRRGKKAYVYLIKGETINLS